MTYHAYLWALLFALIVILVLMVCPFYVIVRGRRTAKRNRMRGTIVTAIGIVFLLCVYVPLANYMFWAGPWHTRILTHGVSPSGREYCVVQSFRDLAEPYRISFYIRDTNGVWRWNYLDHQGYAWLSAHVSFNEIEAIVYRGGERYRDIPKPTDTVDLATVRAGYRSLYCPPDYSVDDVFRFHSYRWRVEPETGAYP